MLYNNCDLLIVLLATLFITHLIPLRASELFTVLSTYSGHSIEFAE